MQHTEKMQKLIEPVRLNPGVRSCIQRIICEVVPDSVSLSENGKPLNPDLQRLLGPWMSTFLQNSIEMAFMCGFVSVGKCFVFFGSVWLTDAF